MMRGRGIRNVERKDIGARQQLIKADIVRIHRALDVGREPRAVMVKHGHVESARAPRDRLADAPHAEDAERRAMYVVPEELLQLPSLPLARAQPRFGFGQPPRRREDQCPGEIGGGVVEHARRVGRHHAARRAGGHVDVVVADRDVAHRFEAGTTLQQRGVDALGQRNDGAVFVRERLRERVRRERNIGLIGGYFEVSREVVEGFLEDLARYQYLGFHRRPSLAARLGLADNPARTSVCGRSAARMHVKCIRECSASPSRVTSTLGFIAGLPWRYFSGSRMPRPTHPCVGVRRRECTLSAFANAPPHPRASPVPWVSCRLLPRLYCDPWRYAFNCNASPGISIDKHNRATRAQAAGRYTPTPWRQTRAPETETRRQRSDSTSRVSAPRL